MAELNALCAALVVAGLAGALLAGWLLVWGRGRADTS
jgi:high-affinity Fe2+/Pb2+ permease